MIAKTTIDMIEIADHDIIQIRFGKIIVDDDGEEIVTWHRACVEPGVDVHELVATVTAHLAMPEMGGYPAPDASDVRSLQSIVQAVHTPEVIKANKERREAMQRDTEPRPALTPDGLMQKRLRHETVIRRDGTVIVRRDQVIESNGVELARRNLDPVVIEPGANADDRLADAGLEPAHVTRVRAITAIAHAPRTRAKAR